ncbi:MAG: hypothetical protein JST75_03725 [Bacteroidetes bacterium]|nr:hypothetical protein [Bacteroidota bacterium]
MGMFLSITSVVGKLQSEVANSLSNYAKSVGGGLEQGDIDIDSENFCVIEEADSNTTIFNPNAYLEWDDSSRFISTELNAPVFSFHIHDGDLWMYVLFVNGEIVDQFNPIPDYWEENITEEEIQSWRGNPTIVAKYVNSLKQTEIEKYLVRWDSESEGSKKAYSDDEFAQEDWQLLDFMKKLKLPYPLYDDGKPKGQVYKLWTKQLQLKPKKPNPPEAKFLPSAAKEKKPWWKFWS